MRGSLWRMVLWASCSLVAGWLPAQDVAKRPDVVLRGTIRAAQEHTYVEAPFTVPPGTTRVTLRFAYTGREQRTTIDLGLKDGRGLRCWSGGNKSVLTVSEPDATPSCLPGRIEPGRWAVLMGVPNLRKGQSSEYTAELFFGKSGLVARQPEVLRTPVRTGTAWYRGDLHLHTGHSDGVCTSLGGKKVPCPVFVTAEAAVRRGLDFIAITDHNTTSQNDAMRELMPYFDTLLLMPGREVTTFHGHFSLWGTEDFLDFRLGSSAVPDVTMMLRRANALGGVVSINHPGAPTGEDCMGCGWDPSPGADMRLVQAIEVLNGGAKAGDTERSVRFWETQLKAGYRITAVGGSDSHTPQRALDEAGSVGLPTTVVEARELSTAAVLDGIRAGHVFLDASGTRTRRLAMRAATGNGVEAQMGDRLTADTGEPVEVTAEVASCTGATVVLLVDGLPTQEPETVQSDAAVEHWRWSGDGHRHWLRVEVRGPKGELWLFGNPVYVNWQTDL